MVVLLSVKQFDASALSSQCLTFDLKQKFSLQEQLCGPQDIFDEKGISKVAITVAALVAIGTNPRQSAV